MMTKKISAFTKLVLIISFFSMMNKAFSQHPEYQFSPAAGRWDITFTTDDNKQYPSWMEFYVSGFKTLVGQFVYAGGSARPIAHVYEKNSVISFSIPVQWETDSTDLKLEGTLNGDQIAGNIITPGGKNFKFTAVRAPSLKRTSAPVWGKEVALFNGKDTTGWHAMGPNQWIVENGVLKSPKSGANLVTDDSFNDFKLHIEFRCPPGSNSGVYLRGRYECQIEDGDSVHPTKDRLGAVYGFLEPSEDASKKGGEWQTYDVTLIGRMVTVALNGKTIICNREIPGITGGALNSNEGEPGPLMIQGDHGPIEYRNIKITTAK